ncbi:Crp/Fnr family transcriptional regulator [Acuticoccus sp. M5D2P5]|uniref:Crp/Fnr family transcriptional regulator n=1 Tax=Acuticoccus kalidii TaxID=2910977 RepID=UPI001F2F350B|nr:Crp/Fnr family transcriptional regulator [Acuticoccus kalidii]MCF3934518.1 Crp/Fnr family transcriptional regulator [Acuticoccus kalidii]
MAIGTEGDWTERFADLSAVSPEIRAELLARSDLIRIPRGSVLFEPGQQPKAMVILLEGTARVQQRSETGREVSLYRVHGGESCVMTTGCLLASEAYSAEGIAETDITAIAIPNAVFDDLLSRSKEFREFIFHSYARRLTDLFVLIEDLVFKRVDVRLAARLIALAQDDGVVKATHQNLATELGTAREVISRTLHDFQKRGLVEQARGEIRITKPEPLRRLAQS